MRLRVPLFLLLFMLPPKPAAESAIDNFDGDEIVILGEDGIAEMTLTVRQRAAAPLTPSSRVIKASEFQGKFSDLPSVLETVSGVNIRSTGGYGQYAESAIRGSSADGVRVYLDGVLLNSASAGAVDLSKIPLDRITEIRVTKSASGLRQMGEGMGGVIELFTDAGKMLADANGKKIDDAGEMLVDANGKNIDELTITNKDADGELVTTNNQLVTTNKKIIGVNFEAGSFGYLKGGLLARPSNNGKIKQQFNVDVSKSDNDYPFTHDNGTTIPTRRDPDPTWDDTLMRKKNNYYRSIDAMYSVSVDISENHRISQRASGSAFEQGLFNYHYKEGQSGSTGGSAFNYSVDYQGGINSKLTIGGAAGGVYRRNALSDPDGHFSVGGAGRELESEGGGGDVLFDAKYALTGNFYLSGMVGARAERYVQRNKALSGGPEMNRREYRAGAEAGLKAKMTESVLRAAYKYEVDTSSAGAGVLAREGRRYSIQYPLAEGVFRLNLSPVALQLSAAASKRGPTFFERFGWGSGFLSNPDLREETRYEADAGASLDMGVYGVSASAFAGRVKDKIKSIPLGGSFVKVFNFADTRFFGAEFDANAKLFKIFTAELSAAYLNSVIDNAADRSWVGKTEPFAPAFSGFLKTEADVRKLNIGHGAKYESECYLSVENRVERPRQIELSAWAAGKITEFLTLRYRVENYLNTANFDFLDNPKPRRRHTASAALSF